MTLNELGVILKIGGYTDQETADLLATMEEGDRVLISISGSGPIKMSKGVKGRVSPVDRHAWDCRHDVSFAYNPGKRNGATGYIRRVNLTKVNIEIGFITLLQ